MVQSFNIYDMKTVLIITGGAGTGKTRLARHLRETQNADVHYADNVVVCSRLAFSEIIARNASQRRVTVIDVHKLDLISFLVWFKGVLIDGSGVEYSIIDLDIVSYETR